MKKNLLLILLSLFTFSVAYSQEEPSEKFGKVTLKEVAGMDWYQQGYEAYSPNKKITKKISKDLQGYDIIIFAGTWCPDTRNLLPKFAKVLNETGVEEDNIQVYLVDRFKRTPGGESDTYEIKSVPTFIFIKDGKEVGRLVERVNKSVEADIYYILKK